MNRKIIFVFFFICFSNYSKLNINLSFEDYMEHSTYFKAKYANKNNNWKIVQSHFNKFRTNNSPLKKSIPKKIHQIWLGSDLPENYNKLINTWKFFHPDWEYKLWTDKDIEDLNLYNIDLYNKTKNYGEKSDILRYEILHRYGGLYVDCDFECLKPFDCLNCCDFYAGLGYSPEVVILCGLIGSIPGHPILKACIETMKRKDSENESFDDILKRSSVFHFTDCFFKYYTTNSIAFPVTFFYPLPDFERDSKKIKGFIKPESFAIHYWHLSWNKGKLG